MRSKPYKFIYSYYPGIPLPRGTAFLFVLPLRGAERETHNEPVHPIPPFDDN